MLGAFGSLQPRRVGGDARTAGMEQLHGCPGRRDGMFPLLLCPEHPPGAVGAAGPQPVAAAWEGSSRSAASRFSASWHSTAPMWHQVITELDWLLSSPGLLEYKKLRLLLFFKSQCQIFPFYHCILVLFSPCAVAEFWSPVLSCGARGGVRGGDVEGD